MRAQALGVLLFLVACDDPAPDGGPTDAGVRVDAPTAPDASSLDVRLAADRASVDLGLVLVGETGTPQRVVVTSTGTAAVVGVSVQVVGASADEIVIDGPGTSCDGATLAPGESCDVSLRLVPTRDASALAVLRVAASGVTLDVPLAGEGVTSCDLSISPTPFTFGDVPAGTTSVVHPFTILDPCRVGLTGRLSVSLGGADAARFVLATDPCTGMTLAARGSCTVEVAFAPIDASSRTAMLVVTASPGGTTSAALAGRGI